MTPMGACVHVPPKLGEVIKPSDGVMSIRARGHKVTKLSGLTVPQSRVKLANA